ncbi:TBC1 domain family member 1 isoform X2 [Tachysurus ichikawai]
MGPDSPLRHRRHSWRQQIFLRVATPQKGSDTPASASDLQSRRLKLDYEEITPCLKDVTLVWEKMLSTSGRSKVKFDTEKIHTAVGQAFSLLLFTPTMAEELGTCNLICSDLTEKQPWNALRHVHEDHS